MSKLDVDPVRHLTYGTGPKGSKRLRAALASFLQSNFRARDEVKPSEIVILAGVGSTVDSMTWALCDEGEGVIIPRPLYTGFRVDVPGRNRAVILPAAFQDIDGYKGFDDVFDPAVNAKALERAYEKAKQEGGKPKALIISK